MDTGNPDCNLKVPVIFEDSPYYANLGPSRNWAVDHELGSRRRRAPPSRTSTRGTRTRPSHDLRVGLGAARLRGHARRVAGHRALRRLPDLGRTERDARRKAVIDWLNGRATAYTTRTGTTTMTADWTTGKVGMMGTSYNGTIPDRRRHDRRRGPRGDRPDLRDLQLVRLLPRERRRARAVHLPGRGPRRARGRGLLARRRAGPAAPDLPELHPQHHPEQHRPRDRRLQPVLGRPQLHERRRRTSMRPRSSRTGTRTSTS